MSRAFDHTTHRGGLIKGPPFVILSDSVNRIQMHTKSTAAVHNLTHHRVR